MADEEETEASLPPPHLVFFDEANRVDIEGLIAPVQAALDRMQARKPGGVITLGRDQYVLPAKVWRIFAGNSPATDIGRKEQSRPFKRRLSVVSPPDPMDGSLRECKPFPDPRAWTFWREPRRSRTWR